MGVRKSRFVTGSQPIPDDATFDYVAQGQNLKITKANLVTEFGTTGSLEALGDPLATPVLNKSGSINQIRNIEDGQGVKASVSPQGGVEVEHNLATGTIGLPILLDNVDKSTLIRNLVSGTGINIAVSGDALAINATGTTVSANTVVVNSMDDFPAAVAGVRTLADDTGYIVSGDLTTSDRFVFGDKCTVYAADRNLGSLTYTGTGTFFTGSSVTCSLKDIGLYAGLGKLFDISSTLGSGNIFIMSDCMVGEVDEFGSISGLDGQRFSNISLMDIKTNGITATGTNGVMLFNNCLATVNGGSFMDLGAATFNSLSYVSCFATLAGGTFFLTGAASSANITAGNLGSVTGSRFFGAGTPLSGITVNDARWKFDGNDDIQDTRPDGLLSLQGNATTTTITTAGVYELIAGTWVVDATSQATGTTAGRITYDGQQPARLPITASVSVEPVSGVNINVSVRVAINGTTVANSERKGTASAGSPTSITIPWQETFNTTDYVEIFVANDDNTTDLLVSSAVHRVN